MHNKTCETVLLQNKIQLLVPQIDRAVVQKIEKCVILHGGDRKLQRISDKEGHNGAAPTALRIEVRNVWNGHINRKVKFAEPARPTIQHGGAKGVSAVTARISVNFPRAAQ